MGHLQSECLTLESTSRKPGASYGPRLVSPLETSGNLESGLLATYISVTDSIVRFLCGDAWLWSAACVAYLLKCV